MNAVHLFATEYGWDKDQVNRLTVPEANFLIRAIETDRKRAAPKTRTR